MGRMVSRAYDYVIVGAGSAGCVLARRLTEGGSTRVLVLEAGGWDRDPMMRIPLNWGRMLANRKHDWGYDTEPEPAMGGRPIECVRGKIVGGSSSINAMAYVRGHRADYDRWAAAGLPGWSYAHALPYFRRQEAWQGPPSEYRGTDGPLVTQFGGFLDPLNDAIMQAGAEAGHRLTHDYNGADQEGFSHWQFTIRDGRRWSGADGYLRPALKAGGVEVVVRAQACRIVFEGARAVGIDYLQGGRRQTVRAEREVILAAGVINSPQLLMLSGIGDPEELARHGIPVRVAMPGVGRNLQDHISSTVGYRRREPGTLHRAMRADRILIELARAHWFGTGVASQFPTAVMAFLKSSPDVAVPDIQFLCSSGALHASPYLSPFVKPYVDSFGIRAVLLRPESRGWVSLASGDPLAAPRIVQNFLSTDRDKQTLRAGLRLARDVGRQAALSRFVASVLAPRSDTWSDGDLDAHIAASGITVHHPLGTCKMGSDSDETAVVNDRLQVRGVEGLRVVDASVMPDLVGGNINAAVVMIAEKASDLIRGLI
jgi:4-pyridoxate dehydrogenase